MTDPLTGLPELIYHYTAAAGLQGILESSAIWATDVHYLNDYTELVDSRDRFLEIMRSLAKKPHCGDRHLAVQFAERIEREQWPDPRVWPPGPFVSCFCSSGDLLSQWRGYGRGGYALGFHRASLDAPPAIWPADAKGNPDRSTLPSRIGLVRVEYATDAQEAILQQAAEAIIRPDDSVVGLGRTSRLASLVAASIKRDAFEEEREWRFIVTSAGTHDEKFRTSASGMFIPYVAIPLDLKRSLVSITVGPSDGQDRVRLDQRVVAVERLLRAHGLSDSVDVIPSKVPFREI